MFPHLLLLPWRSSVDDLLCIDDLEVYVEASQAMLVLHGSAKYLTSPNCQREVAAGKRIRLPLVRVHDGDSSKNGLPLDELRRTAESHRLARQHSEYLFGRNDEDVIPWHRAIDFQLRSLAAIAERMLLATPAYESLDALPVALRSLFVFENMVAHLFAFAIWYSPKAPHNRHNVELASMSQ